MGHRVGRDLTTEQQASVVFKLELPDVAGIGLKKADETEITEKARELQKNINFWFINYAKTVDCESQQTSENSERIGNIRLSYLSSEKPILR